ncbi:hypothetical protein BC835DRAFT_1423642 [Cytidiella melzeri]|nr:hypothetical protein BC835DRAFT_1423642 [Cytidiella melzeri]
MLSQSTSSAKMRRSLPIQPPPQYTPFDPRDMILNSPSLYQENFTLKTKHNPLLAHNPGRDLSPLPLPTRSLSPLPRSESPQFHSVSRLSSSPVVSRHLRRGVCLSADQNARLLGKPEKSEEESAYAGLAGKRKLRELEKEIAGPRVELYTSREKGEELEQNPTAK